MLEEFLGTDSVKASSSVESTMGRSSGARICILDHERGSRLCNTAVLRFAVLSLRYSRVQTRHPSHRGVIIAASAKTVVALRCADAGSRSRFSYLGTEYIAISVIVSDRFVRSEEAPKVPFPSIVHASGVDRAEN